MEMFRLITLMLVRYQMTTKEAIAAYHECSREIFSRANKRLRFRRPYKEAGIRRAIEKLNQRHSLETASLLRLGDGSRLRTGNGVVFSADLNNMDVPRPFSTYERRVWETESDRTPACQIWQAARATTAAPSYFEPIEIADDDGTRRTYVDGAVLCNNPTEQVLRESERLLGPKRRLGCIISIGTGKADRIALKPAKGIWKALPFSDRVPWIPVSKELVTATETVHTKLSERFTMFGRTYFRFQAGDSVKSVALDEWERLDEIESRTRAYLQDVKVSNQLDLAVEQIDTEVSEEITLEEACTNHPPCFGHCCIRP